MRMENRNIKIAIGCVILIIILLLFSMTSCKPSKIEAYAANVATTPRNLVQGDWNIRQNATTLNSGTGEVKFSGNTILRLYMYSTNISGQGNINKNSNINWSRVNLEIVPYAANNIAVTHKNFKLYRRGAMIKDVNYSSATTLLLIAESLSDGVYNFTYTGSIRIGSAIAGMINYEFAFEVDNSNPSHRLTTSLNQTLSNNSYTSLATTYKGSDDNFSKIYYRKNSGMWSNSTNETFLVNKADQNGFWEFYTIDKAGNRTDNIGFYFDNIAPTAVIKNSKDQTISNNQYTNLPFKVIFSDANLDVNKIYVKNPNSNSFVKYTNGSLINDLSGTYTFKATDKANNESASLITCTLDKIKPLVKIYLDDELVTSGKILNGQKVKALAYDEGGSGVKSIFVKTPSSTNFVSYTQGSIFTDEGIYEFYAVDKASNTSTTSSITIDRMPPNLSLYTNEDVTGKPYASYDRVKCLATDSLSGLDKVFVKTKDDASFTEYSNNTFVYANGNVSFYAIDKANNQSQVMTINLDNIAPVGNIYVNNQIYSREYVTESFRYQAEDENSMIAKQEIFYDNLWRTYEGEVINNNMPEGVYKFRAIDNALNVSNVLEVILSITPPTIEINIGNESVDSGSYINRPFSFKAIASDCDIVKCEIRLPNKEQWNEYIDNTPIGEPLEDGEYSFRALDDKGLYSSVYTVNVDTIKPEIEAYVDSSLITAKYIKGGAISFSSIDINDCNIYVKVPNSNTYSIYHENSLIYSQGRYYAYAKDAASNKSREIEFILDNSKKSVILSNTSFAGMLENEAILDDINTLTVLEDPIINFSLESSNENLAPIDKVKINGIEIGQNQTINTIEDGRYVVEVIDRAENLATYTFYSKVLPLTYEQIYTTWYEVKYINATADLLNEIKQFQKLENELENIINYSNRNEAFAFATSKEQELVIEIDWNIDYVFELDEEDRINRKEGVAYIYRHSKKSKDFVIYFTKTRLEKVLRDYATQAIRSMTFIEGNPIGEMANTFEYVEGIVASKVLLDVNLSYRLNNEIISLEKSIFNLNGRHDISVYDSFGNSKSFEVNIISAPIELAFMSNGNEEILTEEKSYFSKKFSLKSLKTIEPISIIEIYNSGGNLIKRVFNDEIYDFEESGIYKIKAYNHSNKVNTKTIYLSLSTQSARFQEGDTLVLNIIPSKESFAPIQTISVYRKFPSSDNYAELLVDDSNTPFAPSNRNYVFLKSAKYKVVLEDSFRRGRNGVVLDYTFELALNPIQVIGVENGEVTNKRNIVYTPNKNVSIRVLKDDNHLPLNSTYTFRQDGVYKISETNADGIEQSFLFSIKGNEYSSLSSQNSQNVSPIRKPESINSSSKISSSAVTAIVIISAVVFLVVIFLIIRRKRRGRY